MQIFNIISQDVTIGEFRIPKDTIVVPQISCVLTDDKIFNNAQEFRPERFMDNAGVNKDLMDQVQFSFNSI